MPPTQVLSLLRASWLVLLFFTVASALPAPSLAKEACAAPPGFNVHRVLVNPDGHVFWRGGAPRIDTVEALAREAERRGVTVTLIDLRNPPSTDDLSGKGGRLSPDGEVSRGAQKGLHVISVSALDKELPSKIHLALKQGDVYVHCMYGVNRTGFAVARYARRYRASVSRDGLGKRDWEQGTAFEKRLEGTKTGR